MIKTIKCSECVFKNTVSCDNQDTVDTLGCNKGKEMSKDRKRLIKALMIMDAAGTLDNEMKCLASGYYGECVDNACDLADNLLEEIAYYEI